MRCPTDRLESRVGSFWMAHEDFFLKLDTEKGGAVKGEAQDSEHKDEIEVIGWSWAMTAATSATGMRKGRATVHQLVVRKWTDSSSTALMGAVARNDKIKSAVLTARRAGKGQQTFLKVTLRNAFITAFEIEGTGGVDGPGTVERLQMAFERITVDYTPQGPDGQPRGGTSFEETWAPTG
jgi:type VI secretion system secreted protein Hcp